MKKHLIYLSALTVTLASAQEKPKDPFLKDNKPAPAAVDAEEKLDPSLLFQIETIRMPQMEYARLMEKPEQGMKLHEQAAALVKGGKACLDSLQLLRTKSGQRATLSSVEEVQQITTWAPSSKLELPPSPQEMSVESMGDQIELDPILNADQNRADVNLSVVNSSSQGLRELRADQTLPGRVTHDFLKQESLSATMLYDHAPRLVSSFSREGQTTLVFATLHTAPYQKPQVAKPNAELLNHTAWVISTNRMRAWDLLAKHQRDEAALFTELHSMLKGDDAALEHVSSMITKPGNRSSNRSATEFVYVTQPLANETDARQLGYSWEIDPIINTEGTLMECNMIFSHVTHEGALKDPLWSPRWPQLPLFITQQVQTAVGQVPGSTVLVSTLNPPGATGLNEREDGERVWFLFLQASAE